MDNVLTFLRPGITFEPSELAALCQAYDKVCATLRLHDRPAALKEALAAEIIAIASMGNVDPDYLAGKVLQRVARAA